MKKTLVVLSLVTLLLFSLSAMAASKNGYTTTQGGRQTTAPAGHFLPFNFQPPADEAVIYNNLSNYPLGVYWCCTGYTISGPNSIIGATYADAMPFTPSANGTVNKIAVAVGWVTGANAVTVSLNADAGGVPGAVIGKFDLNGLPSFGSCCVVESKSSSKGASVTAGTQYWVVVQTTSGGTDTWAAWNDNDTNQTIQPTAFYNNGSWLPSSGIVGGMAVLGH